jgi:hypothetical protein
VSPIGEFGVTGSSTSVTFQLARPEPGWLGSKRIDVMIDRARICLDCGFVMIYVKADDLKALRRADDKHGLSER